MKNLLLIVFLSITLVGCTPAVDVPLDPLSDTEYYDLVTQEIGSDDVLESIELLGNNILIRVDLAESQSLSPKELASLRYSSITDKLLKADGHLEDITVQFSDDYSITMNTSEKVTEAGSDAIYFDTNTIDSRFREGIYEASSQSLSTSNNSIDWDFSINEVKEELTNPDLYHYVQDIGIDVDEDKNLINFTVALGDSTNLKTSLEFADLLIRQFSNSIAIHNDSINPPSSDNYGSLFDSYDINIGVAPMSKLQNVKEWYVVDVIRKGTHNKPKLNKIYR